MKTCTKCKGTYEKGKFQDLGDGRLASWCKPCTKHAATKIIRGV